jgi:hypothetical protein
MFYYIPPYFKDTETFRAVMDSINNQLNNADGNIIDDKNQIYVDSATWGLKDWEGEYSLPTNENEYIEIRRAKVKSKIGCKYIKFKDLINLFVKTKDATVELAPEAYVFKITLPMGGFFFKDLIEAVEEFKPAHYAVKYTASPKACNIILSEAVIHDFLFKYPICNTFVCRDDDRVSGKYIGQNIPVLEQFNATEVKYNACGTFTCNGENMILGKYVGQNIPMLGELNVTEIKYNICGMFVCGGDDNE